jgi:hypothetical protein
LAMCIFAAIGLLFSLSTTPALSLSILAFGFRTAQAARGSNTGLLWRPRSKAPPFGRGFCLASARLPEGLDYRRRVDTNGRTSTS